MDVLRNPIDEVRTYLLNSEQREVFDSLSLNIEDSLTKEVVKKTGLINIVTFLREWYDTLQKLDEKIPLKKENLNHLESLFAEITHFIQNVDSTNVNQNLQKIWHNTFGPLNAWGSNRYGNHTPRKLIIHTTPEYSFLLSLTQMFGDRNIEKVNDGAIKLFRGDTFDRLDSDTLLGAFAAMDFQHSLHSRQIGKSSVSRHLNSSVKGLQEKADEMESYYAGQLSELNRTVEELKGQIAVFLQEKQESWGNWHSKKDNEFINWFTAAKNTNESLEAAYRENLSLSVPATYWKDRKDTMSKHGYWALAISTFLILSITGCLWYILTVTPDLLFKVLFGQDIATGIRWSITLVAFLAFAAVGIRVINKYMFSCFHLARDAEERLTLTQYYQSLLKEGHISEEERKLVIQALFSRSDTGLLKEDSAPTMPMDIVTNLSKSGK